MTHCSFLGTSTIHLRLEIAKGETALAEMGVDLDHPHDMSPAILIQNGLDLEEQQYIFNIMTHGSTILTVN